MSDRGTLYLCATPIGNLEDISLRALRVLREVDLVAAEDTRRTRKLFSHYDIHTPLTSYHEHNCRSKGPQLIGQILAGKNIALVTDAGLPGISDPGEKLAVLAAGEGVKVVPVPGPSASLAALVVSGLPTGRFCFEGFLPARGKDRRRRLEDLKREQRTLVLYEAPHRLAATLADLAAALGDRRICIARELTKRHEEIWRGSLEEAGARFRDNPPRGEITLVLEGSPEPGGVSGREGPAYSGPDLKNMVDGLEQGGMSRKEAIREAARRSGVPRREVYSTLLEQKKTGGL
jgi:16S rRNA (cytidine1402-2'-O)-methyltransferase